ncbi:MAG: UrcA family protein, partial [Sandarakinorhabdus sp.]|nr:UrcA family protein [Sandarakinorhabdus sp.]
ASSSFGTTFVAAIATTLFAGACLFGATGPAAAASAPQAITVSYTDLNVASTSGHKALDTRIVRAARSVCANGGRDVRSLTAEARCIDDAVATARSKVYPSTASAN